MAVRVLPAPMRVVRIGDPVGKYPIYSGEGAASIEGRWHNRGQLVIYASANCSTAMLERLAHYNGIFPPNQHFIEIAIPAGASYEVVTQEPLAGWDLLDSPHARTHGSHWLEEKRSVILIVASFVAREEQNVLINPQHSDAPNIRPSLEKPVYWDKRLFGRRQPSHEHATFLSHGRPLPVLTTFPPRFERPQRVTIAIQWLMALAPRKIPG